MKTTIMAIHRTKSGWVELLGQWGRGKAAKADYAFRPATLISDDGDDNHFAWAVTGSMRDAAEIVAGFDLQQFNDGRSVAEFHGNCVRLIDTPEDFWTENEEGDFVPNLVSYPNVIAY